MLPACRTEGEGFAIPPFDVLPSDVEGFMDELREFQSAFHDCFSRREPREHFFDYMVGQCSPLERKSIEPMALQVEGGTIRGMQRFLSDAVWDEEQMRWTYHHLVADEMGAPDGVLMFDETGFVKKGKESVGVARHKGPIASECARRRVTLCQDGLPHRPVWLVIKRTLGAEPVYSYYISNAPVSTPLGTFVWLSGLRWAIEQCFEEGKTELGMDHYEVRKYPGWHHQMLMTMVAHFFLWHLKLRLGNKSPGADGIAGAAVTGSGLAFTSGYH
jgi:SRSO17 transposase